MLAPPLGSWCPLLREILDPPLVILVTLHFTSVAQLISYFPQNLVVLVDGDRHGDGHITPIVHFVCL